MSEQVIILDTTLRTEPSNGVAFSLQDRLDIAAELASARVDVIEAGRPAASALDHEAVRRVAEEVRTSRISALSRCVPHDIEVAADALEGAAEARLHLYIASDEVDLLHPSTQDRSEAVARAEAMVRMAKDFVSDVEFSVQHATRADPAFLAELVRGALLGGATTINLPDPGFILPDELALRIARLSRDVPELERVVLSFHGHDDLGLATANAIAAVRAGARQIEVAVNGIGERDRNTSLQEVVRALGVHADLLGVATRLDESRMSALSKLVEGRGGPAPRPTTWHDANP
jgi:2-isopropylmalate synthase